jgi:O-antigen ligase
MVQDSIPMEIIIAFYWLAWSLMAYAVNLNIDRELFWQSFLLVLQIIIMGLAIAGITKNRASLNVNFLGMIIGCVILLIASSISGEFHFGSNPTERFRSQSLTSNPNYFGYILLLGTLASLYYWRNASFLKRLLIFGLIGAMSAGILLTASRKTFVGWGVLMLTWSWLCYKQGISKRPALIFAPVIIIVTLYAVSDYMLANTYMGKRFISDLVDNAYHQQKRFALYVEGAEMIKSNPIFGIGLGNFAVLSKLQLESHSDYVEVAASTGIIGFLLYFSIYVVLWRRLGRIQKFSSDLSVLYNVGLLKAGLLSIFVLGFGRPNFKSQLTWMFLATAIGYACSLDKKAAMRAILEQPKQFLKTRLQWRKALPAQTKPPA